MHLIHSICVTMFSHVLQKIRDKLFTCNVFGAPILPWIIPCPTKDVSVFKGFASYEERNKYVTGRKNNNSCFTGHRDSLQSKICTASKSTVHLEKMGYK